MYLKLLLVTLALVGISFLLLGIRTLILSGGKFPNTSVSGNKRLREMGISCAKCEEQVKFNRIRKKKVKINPVELTVAQN